jgi:hypothetical protein
MKVSYTHPDCAPIRGLPASAAPPTSTDGGSLFKCCHCKQMLSLECFYFRDGKRTHTFCKMCNQEKLRQRKLKQYIKTNASCSLDDAPLYTIDVNMDFVCVRCDRTLSGAERYIKGKEGPQKYCKECQRESAKRAEKKYKEANLDAIKARSAEHYESNKDKVSERGKRRYQENREAIKDRHREYGKVYYRKNKKIIKEKAKKNRPRFRKYRSDYDKSRKNTDPNYKIRRLLSSRLVNAIKSQKVYKTHNTLELLGCSISEVRRHIESKFQAGMNWSNHGKHGWHIDHIVPCAAFDLTNENEQRRCFHWSNLQPMWASENQSKKDKTDGQLMLI